MNLSVTERRRLIEEIQAALLDGEISLGTAVRRLRMEVTGLRQAQFAKMCKVSLRTLANIEADEGNPTLKSLNSVFRPFGLEMGLVTANRNALYKKTTLEGSKGEPAEYKSLP